MTPAMDRIRIGEAVSVLLAQKRTPAVLHLDIGGPPPTAAGVTALVYNTRVTPGAARLTAPTHRLHLPTMAIVAIDAVTGLGDTPGEHHRADRVAIWVAVHVRMERFTGVRASGLTCRASDCELR